MENKSALITGVTGQDASYLSEILLEKGYAVYGISRRTANYNLQRVEHLLDNENFHIIYGDVTDYPSIINAIETANPDEFYNLAAMSFVGESWNQPVLTANSVGIGTLNCLEALRKTKKDCRFYQASSSEMFGLVQETPQTEKTPFYPRSPYAVAKCFGHQMAVNYRESYGIQASCGILFNHESARRGIEFVTRKITNAVARIHLGLDKEVRLGNLDSKRDWGHAKDYMTAAWLMLQNEPDDFVIATGKTYSIREFLDAAFGYVGIKDWSKFVVQDPKFFRPAEVDLLLGDSTKAKCVLGWKPEYTFEKMVAEMVENDLRINGRLL